jgi:hypothetical protein
MAATPFVEHLVLFTLSKKTVGKQLLPDDIDKNRLISIVSKAIHMVMSGGSRGFTLYCFSPLYSTSLAINTQEDQITTCSHLGTHSSPANPNISLHKHHITKRRILHYLPYGPTLTNWTKLRNLV